MAKPAKEDKKKGGAEDAKAGAGKDGKQSSALLSSIEESLERQEKIRARELFIKRFEFAKNAMRDVEGYRMGEAMKNFHQYLKVLEEYKRVKRGKLKPSDFDPKSEAAEVALLVSIYWEMSKLYDRTKTKRGLAELEHFLEKYVVFARGTTLEPVCAEIMRKYISRDKPIHKREFNDAYANLKGGKECFIANAVSDEIAPRTIPVLREYRDLVLSESWLGLKLIALYYFVSPTVGNLLRKSPRVLRVAVGAILDSISKKLSQ